MTQTAFVTGGSGFVGAALVRRLVADGWSVRALARSARAATKVTAAGATAVHGRLEGLPSLADQLHDCDVVFHCAACTVEWTRSEVFEQVNVEGTKAVPEACRRARVPRCVHVSSEATLWAGQPLVNVNEDAPLRPDSKVNYCATKARAEQVVMDAKGGLTTVVVRPRLIWGRDDTTFLPALLAAIRTGRFRWVGSGDHLTATTHVDNAVDGLVRAAASERCGRVWFVTDGDPIPFRQFITDLAATQGVTVPDKSIPVPLAHAAAAAMETTWRTFHLGGTPPLTRLAVWLSALEVTIDISRAQKELHYRPITGRADGLAELSETDTS